LVDFAAASFKNTKRAQRKTLQVKDMQAVVNQIEPFEFLTGMFVFFFFFAFVFVYFWYYFL